jgi:hypothetical protein
METPAVLIKNAMKKERNKKCRYIDSGVNYVPEDFVCHLI